MPDSADSLRLYIRQRRQELDKTQREIALACGVTPDYIALIEAGVRRLELQRVPYLADALNVDRAELCRRALAERAPRFYRELFPAS